MRNLAISSISAALLLIPAAVAAGGASSGTINYRATATFSDGTSADRLYSVNVGDLDGDGVSDEGWLRVMCTNEVVTEVFFYSVKSPRDAASGMASGKRQHKPFTITKVVDSSSPLFGKTGGGKVVRGKVSWDLVQGKSARVAGAGGGGGSEVAWGSDLGGGVKKMAADDWRPVVLRAGSPNLCD